MNKNDDLYKLGWEITAQLGVNGATWKIDDSDSDVEIWAGERYFIVTRPDPETFIVTEEKEDDYRKAWRDWADAAHDVITRIVGPRK